MENQQTVIQPRKPSFMFNIFSKKYSTDQVMMTLSAITYTSFDSMTGLQNNLDAAEALKQTYKATWWARDGSTLVYVVRNTMNNDYCIAIGGAVFQFGVAFLFDWYEDLGIAHLTPLSDDGPEKAKTAAALPSIVRRINSLTYNGSTLPQLIKNFPNGSKVYITGHSLGAMIASVYAVQLATSQTAELEIIPRTFAAPSAGNQAFADLFNPDNSQCLFPRSSACVNTLDIIPYAWQDLQGMPAINYGKIKCPIDFTLCVDNLARLLIIFRAYYEQPPLKQLPGQPDPTNSFFAQAMYQHQPDTYLALLGLLPIADTPFSCKQQMAKAETEGSIDNEIPSYEIYSSYTR
jgi:hypothetical protein